MLTIDHNNYTVMERKLLTLFIEINIESLKYTQFNEIL